MELDELDLSRNTALTKLSIDTSEFGAVKLGQCAALTELRLMATGFPELDLSPAKSLKKLELLGNGIARLDLSGLTQFTELDLTMNQLQELELGDNPNLKVLLCPLNKLTRLDIKGCGQLCSLVNSTLPISDFSKYTPDFTAPALLYVDESTGCRLMVDQNVLVLYGFVPVASVQLDKTKLELKVDKNLQQRQVEYPRRYHQL